MEALQPNHLPLQEVVVNTSKFGDYLSSHPNTQQRIDAAKNYKAND